MATNAPSAVSGSVSRGSAPVVSGDPSGDPRDAGVRVPLYRTIADAIIRDVRRGRYLEGGRLPASRDLARTLKVNRATVHQALQLLKRELCIRTNKPRGTRLPPPRSTRPLL